MKKIILILGSDYGTIDLVREAHKMGMYVIVADLMDSSPTKQEADEAWLISTTATDVLEAKCREIGVCGVITGASDFNTACSRKLCAKLGLPVICDNDKAWEIARNKRLFKELCLEVGAPVAKDYYITSTDNEKELDAVTYPVVVKPVDKSANRGMSYCNNKEELIEAYKYLEVYQTMIPSSLRRSCVVRNLLPIMSLQREKHVSSISALNTTSLDSAITNIR